MDDVMTPDDVIFQRVCREVLYLFWFFPINT